MIRSYYCVKINLKPIEALFLKEGHGRCKVVVLRFFWYQKPRLAAMMTLNNRFLRERGMASTPKMEYQVFLCIFQKNSNMATLGLKEMGKFLWEGREKVLPSLVLLLEDAKKNLVFHFGGRRHASFPQKPVYKEIQYIKNPINSDW